MPQPTLTDVHVNRPLSNMSLAYLQSQTKYAHNNVFPVLPVQNKSDSYFVLPRSFFLRDTMRKRAPGTPAQLTAYSTTTATYTCDVWSECYPVADQIRANTDNPLNPDREAVNLLSQHALINREVQWCTDYFAGSIWTSGKAGQSSADSTHVKYWDASGATPVNDVLDAQVVMEQLCGVRGNVLVVGAKVQNALKTSAQIIDRLKYGQTAPGIVTVKDSDLAQLFEVDKVVVASAIKTTSAEGVAEASATYGYIAGNHALLAYAPSAPGIMTPSAGYTFAWTGYLGANAFGTRIKRYRWEKTASDDTEIDSAYAFGVVAADLGYFFNTLITP